MNSRAIIFLVVVFVVAASANADSRIVTRFRHYVHGNSLRVSKPGSFERVHYYGSGAEIMGKPGSKESVVFDIQTLTYDSRIGNAIIEAIKPLVQYRVNGLDTHLDEVRLYAGERLIYTWDKLPATGSTAKYSISNQNGFVSMFFFMNPTGRDIKVQPLSLEVKVKFGGGSAAARTIKFVAVSVEQKHTPF